MVMASAVDGHMGDEELAHIGGLVQSLPAFDGFDSDRLVTVSQACSTLLSREDGLDAALKLIRKSLPEKLHDTAYALAVEVSAADLRLKREELRFLSRLRDSLSLDKLTCAAIERGAIARYRRI
jgi:tellurite resistance protein